MSNIRGMIVTGVSRVMLSYISTRDHNLMRRLNGWRPPRWVRIWMVLASRLGDGWIWYAIGLILLLFGGAGRFLAVGTAALSGAVSVTFFLQLKKLAHRTRPCATERSCWATLLPPDQFSFPSGHSMTAFSVAVPLSLHYPSLEAGLLFCALSIAASRVLLGLHFLSDALAGSLLGAIIGYFAYSLFQ
jgi:undecaprenyl-diphosphatase